MERTSGALLAAAHHDYLYLMKRLENNDSELFRADKDFRWEAMGPESNIHCCLGLVSHQSKLYCAAKPSGAASVHLYEMVFKDEDMKQSRWVEVSNAACCQEGMFDTMAAVGDSILLVGCAVLEGNGHAYLPLVAEYDITCETWSVEAWPELPDVIFNSQPLATRDQLHLIGGWKVKTTGKDEHQMVGNHQILSIKLDRFRPMKATSWKTDALLSTPVSCSGAVQLCGHLLLAGGRSTSLLGKLRYHRECFAQDTIERKWLSLPPMQSERCKPLLLAFHGFLLAIGGFGLSQDGVADHLTSIERWRLPKANV